MSSPCRMIIDVDPGIDDAMAIFYAVRRPGIKLEALTTTFGNTDTAIATGNALRVLELLGRPDIPVAKGVERSFIHPMSGAPITFTGRMRSAISSFRSRRSGRPTSTPAISSSAWRKRARARSRFVRWDLSPTSRWRSPRRRRSPSSCARLSSWGRRYFIPAFTGPQRRWSMRISPMIPKRRISCFGRAPT